MLFNGSVTFSYRFNSVMMYGLQLHLAYSVFELDPYWAPIVMGPRWAPFVAGSPDRAPQEQGVPDRVSSGVQKGLLNCSVPVFEDFAPAIKCNMIKECDGGEDERDCHFHVNENSFQLFCSSLPPPHHCHKCRTTQILGLQLSNGRTK